MALPPGSYAIRSVEVGKYLHCMQDGTLQFSENDFTTPNEQFQVAYENDNSELVNITSFNNKYWMREKPDSFYIMSVGVGPDNNQNSVLCTLFKPEKVAQQQSDHDNNQYRLRHMQLRHYIEPDSEHNFRQVQHKGLAQVGGCSRSERQLHCSRLSSGKVWDPRGDLARRTAFRHLTSR
ncbi:hypothetical protein ACE6H2_018608 [Prunus campanulata]